jgi:hypothetical protein
MAQLEFNPLDSASAATTTSLLGPLLMSFSKVLPKQAPYKREASRDTHSTRIITKDDSVVSRGKELEEGCFTYPTSCQFGVEIVKLPLVQKYGLQIQLFKGDQSYFKTLRKSIFSGIC